MGILLVEDKEGKVRRTRGGPEISIKEIKLEEEDVIELLDALAVKELGRLWMIGGDGIKAIIVPDLYSWLRGGRKFSPINYRHAPGFIDNTIIVLTDPEMFEEGFAESLEKTKLQITAWMAFAVGGYYKKKKKWKYPWGD